MDNRNHKSPQHPERDKSLLGIRKTRVFKRESGTRKNLLSVGEVETMNCQIGRAFRVIPIEPNGRNVYTKREDVKGALEDA
jgi:hypothetical protein